MVYINSTHIQYVRPDFSIAGTVLHSMCGVSC